MQNNPPYDGKPCPMCPLEIRGLAAIADNVVKAWDQYKEDGSLYKVAAKIEDLRDIVKMAQPFVDAHFADHKHWRSNDH